MNFVQYTHYLIVKLVAKDIKETKRVKMDSEGSKMIGFLLIRFRKFLTYFFSWNNPTGCIKRKTYMYNRK